MFKKETYINRRKQLIKDVESGIILIIGNEEAGMNYAGNTYHFRQDSSFLYFFGLDFPGLAGVIDVDEGKEYIFGDDYTIDDIVWMGTQSTIAEKSQRVGIENTGSVSELATLLAKAKSSGRNIHFLPPYRNLNRVKLLRWLDIHPDKANELSSVELVKAIVNQRNYKSEEEIVEIEKAVNTTVEMHLAAMKMVRPGITEAEVAAKVYEVALAAGGDISFPIIATINGQTLHNHYHGNTLKSGDLFLLDAGAETTMRYAGDMSSTIPVDAKFTARQREIYQVAFDAHEKAVSMLRPGIKNKEIHLEAAKVIASGMKDLGFMKGNVNDAVEAGAHAMFFPCGLGHMMGLDVHDMEDLGEQYVGYDGEAKSTMFGLKSLRLGRKLDPGFVLTIEPGIYFIPELIDKWRAEGLHKDFLNYDKIETYKDFGGIRNEEDFLITETGARLLGKPLPKSMEDVEAVKGK